MREFAITIIQPPNYVHSLAFLEIGQLLHSSLLSLGLKSELHFNRLEAGKVNIILGYNLLTPADSAQLRDLDYIILQLEQLSNSEGWFNEQLLLTLKNAEHIWDYSEQNLAFLQEYGINHGKLLPIGYHPDLERIEFAQNRDIDVLFYGSVNERRAGILDELKKSCKLETLFGVYGERRDAYIARSKIVLNMHFYEAQLLEQVRLSYLLNNGCFVISEGSRGESFGDTIVTAELDALVATCLEYLGDEQARNTWAEKGHRRFKSSPMPDELAKVLEDHPS